MHYGYIGLGNLGAACAGCLLKAGFQVTVYDLNPALAAPLVAAGATLAPDDKALAGSVDHVITCLPSPAVSERVLASVLPHMRPGASWIEMSTLGRDEVLNLSAVAAASGVRMMELPVTGGVHLAHQGKITMLAGGDRDLFDLHHPAMQAMGDIPHGSARVGLHHQGHHQHAGLHPPQGHLRGADAGQAGGP